jgi:hypothetical protein
MYLLRKLALASWPAVLAASSPPARVRATNISQRSQTWYHRCRSRIPERAGGFSPLKESWTCRALLSHQNSKEANRTTGQALFHANSGQKTSQNRLYPHPPTIIKLLFQSLNQHKSQRMNAIQKYIVNGQVTRTPRFWTIFSRFCAISGPKCRKIEAKMTPLCRSGPVSNEGRSASGSSHPGSAPTIRRHLHKS